MSGHWVQVVPGEGRRELMRVTAAGEVIIAPDITEAELRDLVERMAKRLAAHLILSTELRNTDRLFTVSTNA